MEDNFDGKRIVRCFGLWLGLKPGLGDAQCSQKMSSEHLSKISSLSVSYKMHNLSEIIQAAIFDWVRVPNPDRRIVKIIACKYNNNIFLGDFVGSPVWCSMVVSEMQYYVSDQGDNKSTWSLILGPKYLALFKKKSSTEVCPEISKITYFENFLNIFLHPLLGNIGPRI